MKNPFKTLHGTIPIRIQHPGEGLPLTPGDLIRAYRTMARRYHLSASEIRETLMQGGSASEFRWIQYHAENAGAPLTKLEALVMHAHFYVDDDGEMFMRIEN